MKRDWISILAIAIIIASGIVAVQIYYNEKNNECSSNPLVYASKLYEEQFGFKFKGSGYFLMEQPSPIIYFDSENISIVSSQTLSTNSNKNNSTIFNLSLWNYNISK